MSRRPLLQRFFEFYSVYFGITAPPPEKQKLVVGLLVAFVIVMIVAMVVVARLASSF